MQDVIKRRQIEVLMQPLHIFHLSRKVTQNKSQWIKKILHSFKIYSVLCSLIMSTLGKAVQVCSHYNIEFQYSTIQYLGLLNTVVILKLEHDLYD